MVNQEGLHDLPNNFINPQGLETEYRKYKGKYVVGKYCGFDFNKFMLNGSVPYCYSVKGKENLYAICYCNFVNDRIALSSTTLH